MFCSKCGKEIHDATITCPNCGANQVNRGKSTTNGVAYSDYSQVPFFRKNWFAILTFFFAMPILALVLITGPVYYKSKGQVKRYTGLARGFLIVYSFLATAAAVVHFVQEGTATSTAQVVSTQNSTPPQAPSPTRPAASPAPTNAAISQPDEQAATTTGPLSQGKCAAVSTDLSKLIKDFATTQRGDVTCNVVRMGMPGQQIAELVVFTVEGACGPQVGPTPDGQEAGACGNHAEQYLVIDFNDGRHSPAVEVGAVGTATVDDVVLDKGKDGFTLKESTWTNNDPQCCPSGHADVHYTYKNNHFIRS